MVNNGLTDEELNIIALKVKTDGLVRIATIIPSGYYINKLMQFTGTIKSRPDTVEYVRYNLGMYLSFGEEINSIVIEFIKKLEEHSDEINNNTLYKNLKRLKIKKERITLWEKIAERLGLPCTPGDYSPMTNSIRLVTDLGGTAKKIVTHELLHFASTVKQGFMTYCGFEQRNVLTVVTIGTGINEGATEFLNCYLFGYSYRFANYKELVYIVKGIANLIGTDKLMKFYFDNDLKKLEEEIGKYSNIKTAKTIITGLERLHNLRHEGLINKPSSTATELEESLISLLASLNLKKQKDLLEHNEISMEQYERNSLDFAYFYGLGIYTEKQINKVQTRPIYKLIARNREIDLTEKEYLKFIEEVKRVVHNPSPEPGRNEWEIMNMLDNIKNARREIIEKADNIYGSLKDVRDIFGNNLDIVRFNYKKYVEQLNKAVEEGKEEVTMYDKDGNPYTIYLSIAQEMEGILLDSCEKDYLSKESSSNEHQDELKEMVVESSKKQIPNINRK